ncbi:protein FimG [Providencia rustigianii DSM 4541]|uniref:Protein FimG n=2 Tax=Morganellaceae TaxID=1903414 RepID=D1P172_9GAMM|nr:protein FimG [Providencia rustigianii DSM 4541]
MNFSKRGDVMINKKWKMRTALILGLISLSITSTFAADVTVTVNGSVVAKPCTVATTTANVDLGDLYTFNLVSPGAASQWHEVTLDLVNCPVGTSAVTATFKGTTDTTGYYKNQGTATNIQLQLQDTAGNNLNNGVQKKLQVNDSTLSTSFPLQVRALSVKGGATQGSIQATIDVTYTYQ